MLVLPVMFINEMRYDVYIEAHVGGNPTCTVLSSVSAGCPRYVPTELQRNDEQ